MKNLTDQMSIAGVARLRRLPAKPSRTPHLLVADATGKVFEELESDLFGRLRLQNGTYKTTHARRLDDVNAWVEPHLPADRPLRFLDTAISTGTSTIEWAEFLDRLQIDYQLIGTDLNLDGLLVSFGDRLHAVLNRSKRPFMFEINGHFVSYPPIKKHVLQYFVPLLQMKLALWFWLRQYRPTEQGSPLKLFGRPIRCRNVSFLTPRLQSHPRITVQEEDLLADSGSTARFQVIRAANILNHWYFDQDTLRMIVRNLRRQLTEGGLLVVCRTDLHGERINHGTIFKLGSDQRFSVLSRLNGSSEVEELILQMECR
jgi:hypothetical protein